MYRWKIVDQVVQRLSDGAFISNDVGNKDWQAFQEWVKAGNVPQDAIVRLPPPDLTLEKLVVKDVLAKPEDRLNALIKILGI